jgi:hypothetical protein
MREARSEKVNRYVQEIRKNKISSYMAECRSKLIEHWQEKVINVARQTLDRICFEEGVDDAQKLRWLLTALCRKDDRQMNQHPA